MANNIIKRVWNQGSMTPIEDLQGSAFTNENGGHTFQISGVDSNGESLALSGTIAASFLRPDQTTVGISGSVSGGVASVTLSEECYGVPGRFGLVIFMTSDGKKTAIYSCVGNVARSSTDAVAPGVVADVVDLINEIETAVGTIPASYSALMADIAPTYSSSALYAVGDYAWYEGDLKRCIVPITVGETYTPAHWTSAVVGDDVCALKSAVAPYNSINILSLLAKNNSNNMNGLKYAWSGETCNITGTTTSQSVNEIYSNNNVLPSYMVPGKKLYVKYNPVGSDLFFHIRFMNGSTKIEDNYLVEDSELVVPSNATGAVVRFTTLNQSGITVNETVTPIILTALTNEELKEFCISKKGSFISISHSDKISYNISTKVLTIPGNRFYVFNGKGSAYTPETTIDLTNYLSSDACVLWMKSTGVIYGAAWSGKNLTDSDDVIIGYVFSRNVFILGINDYQIEVTDSAGTKYYPAVGEYGAYIGISNTSRITFDATTKVLTIPSGNFAVYNGSSNAISSNIVLDLSGITTTANAWLLWMTSAKTIYGTKWSGKNAQSMTDPLLGYIYGNIVYINGVPQSQISITGPSSEKFTYCFGDSITAGVGTTKVYHMYFHEYDPSLRFYNWGVGGSGYCVESVGESVRCGDGVEGRGEKRAATGDNTIAEVMASIQETMNNIILAGGTNDFLQSIPLDTFSAAVSNTIDAALAHTPRVFVITPPRVGATNNMENNLHLTIKDYVDTIVAICEAKGVVYANGIDVGLNPSNPVNQAEYFDVNDYIHPSAKGHARMARVYWNWLLEALGK